LGVRSVKDGWAVIMHTLNPPGHPKIAPGER
jgi:hypothetical protein